MSALSRWQIPISVRQAARGRAIPRRGRAFRAAGYMPHIPGNTPFDRYLIVCRNSRMRLGGSFASLSI